MIVLGITTECDSGAAVVRDGRVIAAVNEERLTRMKLVVGFPRRAIREVMRIAGIEAADVDAVAVAGTSNRFVDQPEPFDGLFRGYHRGLTGILKEHGAPLLAGLAGEVPALQRLYYTLLGPAFLRRRRAVRRILRKEFGLGCPVRFVDHHFAHLTSAYYTSGFEDALVVSLDGGGDGRSGLVYAWEDGRPRKLYEAAAYDSLGNYYAYITHLCGFKAHKHEGKITGLAAHGEPRYAELLDRFITLDDNGRLDNRGRVVFRGALRKLRRALPTDWRREDLAASIQLHFERIAARFVRHWARESGHRNVALAGGVFANVRVNEEIHKLDGVDRIFVHPHMGDGGLCVGAAMAACLPGVVGERTMDPPRRPIGHVYLGSTLGETEIADALRDSGLTPQPFDGAIEDRVAELLAEGHVVARAAGAMEYGPRALGNRSVLYLPTDPSVNHWLNEKLRRTEFMPFAPATLYEERDRCFHDVGGAEHAAQFMTTTFHCTPWMRERMAGVVHLDGTARPQLVRREANPGFYEIIRHFHERTGLPAVINTSFNMHEEPIVCTAEDCVRGFLESRLDYLAIGGYLVRHPEVSAASGQPVPVSEPQPADASSSSSSPSVSPSAPSAGSVTRRA